MNVRFINTADWQLGRIRHCLSEKAQARFSQARIDASRTVGRMGPGDRCRPRRGFGGCVPDEPSGSPHGLPRPGGARRRPSPCLAPSRQPRSAGCGVRPPVADLPPGHARGDSYATRAGPSGARSPEPSRDIASGVLGERGGRRYPARAGRPRPPEAGKDHARVSGRIPGRKFRRAHSRASERASPSVIAIRASTSSTSGSGRSTPRGAAHRSGYPPSSLSAPCSWARAYVAA